MTSLTLITSSNRELTVNSNLYFFDDDYEIDGTHTPVIGDGTNGALHQEHLPMPSHTPLPPSAASNTPRTRVYHPNTGCSYPGGLNYLQQMDRDEYAHIRDTDNVYYPFASKSEWELARWLSSGALSQKDIDAYLRLQRVSEIDSPCIQY